jgi:hypothetical protein
VVELSNPVEISSMKKAFAGPTSISPTNDMPNSKQPMHVILAPYILVLLHKILGTLNQLITSGDTLSLPAWDSSYHLVSNQYVSTDVETKHL